MQAFVLAPGMVHLGVQDLRRDMLALGSADRL